jgi:ParB family chromosome partitioning protein
MASDLKARLARQASGETQLTFDPAGRDEQRLAELPLEAIDADPNQPRKDLGDLADLALSIREHGIIQPIVVEPRENGRFRILAGERRFAACGRLGRATIPALVRTVAEHSRLELQLVENLHRRDLHPVEEAGAFRRLMNEFNLTQRELAKRLGKSLAAVNQTLRILELDPAVLENVQTSEHATKSVLLEIAKEPDPQRQQALWQEAQARPLSARQARESRSTKSRKSSFTFELADTKIIIRFLTGEASPERVKTALAAALAATDSPGSEE